MGRGRGRGSGGNRGGRGNFRGRGRGRGGNRGRGTKDGSALSRKDSAHLRQFGESHPADGMGEFRTPAKKFKSSDESRRAFGGAEKNDSSEEGSDESEEEEATPYNELLSILTGQKGPTPVQIVSESEEEEDNSGDDIDAENEANDAEDNFDVARNDEISKNGISLPDLREDSDNESLGSNSESEDEDRVVEDNEREDGDGEEDGIEIEDLTVIDEAESDSEAEDDDKSSLLDPFITHFQRQLSDGLQSLLCGNKPFVHLTNLEWPTLEKVQYAGLPPQPKEKVTTSRLTHQVLQTESSIITCPPNCPPIQLNHPILPLLHIKSQIQKTIPAVNQKVLERTSTDILTPLQEELLVLGTAYHDVYFPQRNLQNEEEVRIAYCIHAANHILKTRTRIVHHNAKMKNKIEVPEEYRDQGFVRPKVLILTPFKETALRIVKTLISLVLIEEKGNVQNKKRFVDEYSGETLFLPKTNPKPEDYMAMFSGNVDDNFKIGLAVTKKTIKLYTGFYASDIIVASPVGLRMLVGAEGEKDRDYDFLSSIEVLIMDQADVFLMQNWDHLLHLIRHLHLQPITTHGTDFARIRPWALDNLTKFYCQTLVFSSLICPEHLAFFSRHSKNYAGYAKIINPILYSQISQITVQLPQVFQQFECENLTEASDARFEHFVNKVLPNFKGKLMSHTLIFASSYFDFVRLRNYFRKEEQSFVQICEYTKDRKIARARDLFFHGKNKFLLYTERAHFFRRFRLKGIGHIIFYQLPQYPHFYSELCNYMQEAHQNRRVRNRKNCSVNVIYCKYDATRLASLVGTDRANHMLSSDKPTHAFVTEAI